MATRYNYTGGIVTNGLVLNLDAAKVDSYPGTGTTWRDLSGNNNSGSLVNGPTFSGIGKQAAIVFDGVDDYVSTNYTANPTYFTLELIVKPGNVSTGTSKVFLGKYNGSGDDYWIGLQSSNSNLIFSVNGNILSSNIIPNTSTYYIITAVIGVTLKKIYVNGILQNSTPTSSTSPGGRLAIANFGDFGFFATQMTSPSLKIYNRELTDLEILQNFNALRGRYGI
jgi:hypothetical protein